MFVSVNRNMGLSTDHADADLLDSINEDLKEVIVEIDKVAEGIAEKRGRTVHRHSWRLKLGIDSMTNWAMVKTVIILGICFMQYKLVVQHFEDSKHKRQSVNPYENNMI